MDRLSKEITLDILSCLNNSDRIKCMCLNQYWYRVVVDDFGFHKIVKISNQNVNKAFKLFERKQELGRQVRQLVETNEYETLDLRRLNSLPRLFPNLKVLDCFDGAYGGSLNNDVTTPQQKEWEKWKTLKKSASSKNYLALYCFDQRFSLN